RHAVVHEYRTADGSERGAQQFPACIGADAVVGGPADLGVAFLELVRESQDLSEFSSVHSAPTIAAEKRGQSPFYVKRKRGQTSHAKSLKIGKRGQSPFRRRKKGTVPFFSGAGGRGGRR